MYRQGAYNVRMTLVGAIQPYKLEGFIHQQKGVVCGNGWLFTAHYVLALRNQKDIPTAVVAQEIADIRAAMIAHQVEPGLLKRTVGNAFGQESIDDYVGACLLSYLLDGGELARDILAYGKRGVNKFSPNVVDMVMYNKLRLSGTVKYVYNNITPGVLTVRSYMGRYYHLICLLQYIVGEKPSWFYRFMMVVYFMGYADPSDLDSYIRPWLVSIVCKKRSWAISLSLWFWRRRATKFFGDPSNLISKYFASKGFKEQPIGVHLAGISF